METFKDLKANNCSYQAVVAAFDGVDGVIRGTQADILCLDNMGTTVTDLGIWGKALSHNEMVAWSTCR